MTQNHTFEDRSSDGRRSIWWSLSPNGGVLVFVHGFLGGSVTTWRDFPGLLLSDPMFAGYDLHFYGYDSASAQAEASAALLHAHLDMTISDPLSLASISTTVYLGRPSSFRYTNIIVTAHSLGAAITRKAMLRLWEAGKISKNDIQLVCFGPAHAGARARSLLGEIQPLLLFAPIWVLAKFWYPVLDDLDPSSNFIKLLKEDTEKALLSGNADCMRARLVVFGQYERVVTVASYCKDEQYRIVANADHGSVCKPSQSTDQVFQWLRAIA